MKIFSLNFIILLSLAYKKTYNNKCACVKLVYTRNQTHNAPVMVNPMHIATPMHIFLNYVFTLIIYIHMCVRVCVCVRNGERERERERKRERGEKRLSLCVRGYVCVCKKDSEILPRHGIQI